jgi:hypothetical protein
LHSTGYSNLTNSQEISRINKSELLHSTTRYQRRRLFQKILPDIDSTFLVGWFIKDGGQLTDIRTLKRENLVQWLSWAFFGINEIASGDLKEMDGMVKRIQDSNGITFDPGYNPDLEAIRLGLNTVDASHRPFILYACVCLLEMMGYCCLIIMGYRFIPFD